MSSVSNHWTNVLTGSAVQGHSIYDLSEIHKIPDTPGLYAWYLMVNGTNLPEYYKIYKQKRVNVKIEGTFKDLYHGDVNNFIDSKHFPLTGIDTMVCELVSLAFGPPLYIGISKNLRTRLRDHAKELTKIFYGKITLPTTLPMGKSKLDTIYESSHFAQRVGFTLKDHPTIDLTSFRIRTLEMPKTYSWQNLQKIERYINRTYIPIYGRK